MPSMTGRVEACVFDAYGTLLDLASAVAPHERGLGGEGHRLLALWRAKQLEYTWLRTVMRRHADFDAVTRDALAYALEALGIDDQPLEQALLDSFRTLQAHPEAVPLLEALRRRGIRTAVLSNGTPATLDVALARAGLAPLLDAVLSVERVQCYKPDPRVYVHATAALAVPADRTLFVSMHGWDVAGAASAGCRTAWVNRVGAPRDRLPAGPDHTVRSLAEIELLAFR
jgi:2-haloacid dehalogenase